MEFSNEFRVGVPVAEAWAALTTLERVAPCMPGAQLTGVEGDEHQGTIKVKVGPVTAQYKGVASFESQDPEAHRAVLVASGRDTRGQGNASARVEAQLTPDGDGTLVSVATKLTITGKIAQFGRGIIADVSDKLLQTFATNLEKELTSNTLPADGDGPAAGAGGAVMPAEVAAPDLPEAPVEPAAGPERPGAEAYGPDTLATETGEAAPASAPVDTAEVDTVEVEAIDLLAVAQGAILKRLVPVMVAVVVLAALVAWLLF